MRTESEGRITWTPEGFDEAAYWQRVERNLGWMGNTLEESRENQLRLRNATIGIAGTGGIGGAAAMRLVRMGAGHIKIADPEDFEVSNIQRQFGAGLDTVGRNKAEVVAEQVFPLTKDAKIEVFTDGITAENAEEFVEGCDVVTDQIEVFEWDAKYALHRAFRSSQTCKALYAVATIGHGALVHRYTQDSASIEELYEIPEGSTAAPDTATVLAAQAPMQMLPSFPSIESVLRWGIEEQVAPIFGPTPATCEGIMLECVMREVLDLPGITEFPVRPGYAYFDAWSWKTELVDEEQGGAELRRALDAAKAAIGAL